MGDLFDSSIDLERSFCDAGRDEGRRVGAAQGLQEGRDTGLSSGFEIGTEVGFYAGLLRVLRHIQSTQPDALSDRVQKLLQSMHEVIASFPLLHPESEELQDSLFGLRARYKALVAIFGVKLDLYASAAASASGEVKSDLDF
eukprot:jgi/Chlat1/5287/Chrsp35S08975